MTFLYVYTAGILIVSLDTKSETICFVKYFSHLFTVQGRFRLYWRIILCRAKIITNMSFKGQCIYRQRENGSLTRG